MNTSAVTGIFRIRAGAGMSSPQSTTTDPDERVALIDHYLSEWLNDVLFLELKPDENSWDEWGEQDLNDMEFMRVGVNGEFGAAEYMCRSPQQEEVFKATHNPAPTGDEPPVLYDDCVPTYFPPQFVVSRSEVRQLMLDFALYHEWGTTVPWRFHDDLVG